MDPGLDPLRRDNLPATADKRARGELQIVAYVSIIYPNILEHPLRGKTTLN